MASHGTGFSLRSAFTVVDDSTEPLREVTHLRPVRDVVDDSESALGRAGAAMVRVEQEIDHLWHDSMLTDDRAMSQRLAELSHALHRAAHMLEHDDAIG